MGSLILNEQQADGKECVMRQHMMLLTEQVGNLGTNCYVPKINTLLLIHYYYSKSENTTGHKSLLNSPSYNPAPLHVFASSPIHSYNQRKCVLNN